MDESIEENSPLCPRWQRAEENEETDSTHGDCGHRDEDNGKEIHGEKKHGSHLINGILSNAATAKYRAVSTTVYVSVARKQYASE
jgi:hypothetical protein